MTPMSTIETVCDKCMVGISLSAIKKNTPIKCSKNKTKKETINQIRGLCYRFSTEQLKENNLLDGN